MINILKFVLLIPPHICQNNSADSQEDKPSLENAKQVPSEPPQQKSRHFRQRSASDTTFSKLHLSKASFTSGYFFSLFLENEPLVNSQFAFVAEKLNRNSRGQQLSTNNLREIEEEDTTQMVRYMHKHLLKTV